MTEKPTKEERKASVRSTIKWPLVIAAIEIFILPEVAKIGIIYVIGLIFLTLIVIVLCDHLSGKY